MGDNPRVQEINLLIALCVFGTAVVVAVVFVAGIVLHRPQGPQLGAPADTATTSLE